MLTVQTSKSTSVQTCPTPPEMLIDRHQPNMTTANGTRCDRKVTSGGGLVCTEVRDRKVASRGGWVRTMVIVTPEIDSINPPLRIFIDESTLPY
jgi:hypothetical protein